MQFSPPWATLPVRLACSRHGSTGQATQSLLSSRSLQQLVSYSSDLGLSGGSDMKASALSVRVGLMLESQRERERANMFLIFGLDTH